jgi:hypothetical protein
LNKRTKEEQRVIQRKGGKKSGESRQAAAELRKKGKSRIMSAFTQTGDLI